ncbi:hypothetical protein AMJ50_00895 [Parcubacteria bacterium DG_74_3]|nr:MAG: hypothetical protein AMJ50_00895 [Parcubacteria bacterium DG_74_3]
MPELPEVETTVRYLAKNVLGRTFFDVWTDWSKTIKIPKNFQQFKKEIKGRKIKKIWRRGKNILFELSGEKILLIHQKLTGHLLFGKWTRENNTWQAPLGPLSERINSYLHLIFTLDNGQMLALSDVRKFAKVELWDSKKLFDSQGFIKLGPEPLGKSFTFEKFREVLTEKKGKIKQILMNQEVIAGIGNIYSDEILFRAKIHPLKNISELSEKELKRVYQVMRKVLSLAVHLQGESISDYRVPTGKEGGFDKARKVYRRTGERCSRCGTIIKKIKVGGRAAHFCPRCQKYKPIS